MNARALVLVIAVASCRDAGDAPVDPAWGKQTCARCGMVVDEPAYAAEIVASDGARLFFDDVGCMVAYARALSPRAKHAWVHDADSARWLDAGGASYARAEHTPMDWGWTAHAPGGGAVPLSVVERSVSARLAKESSGETP